MKNFEYNLSILKWNKYIYSNVLEFFGKNIAGFVPSWEQPDMEAVMEDSSLAQVAYEHIKVRICDGQFPMGHKMSETQLAKDTQVSRTPVRIALARLEAEGFLTWEANRGYRVTIFSIEDVRAIYGVRAILEAEAVRLSGRRGLSAALVKDLAEMTERMEEIVSIPDHTAEQRAWFLKMNHSFHRKIYDNCGNEFLLRQIASTADLPLALRNFFSFSAEQLTESHSAHVNILAALTSGEADRAAGLMREHIWAARDRMSVKKTKRACSDAPRVPMSRGKRILVPGKERARLRKESQG